MALRLLVFILRIRLVFYISEEMARVCNAQRSFYSYVKNRFFELDKNLSAQKGIRYLRFMNDLLILSKQRWPLRLSIRATNQWFSKAGLQQHPDKTFIGRIEKGFDWLGYRFNGRGLYAPAISAITQHHHKIYQFYELTQRCKETETTLQQWIADYSQRWQRGLHSGLGTIRMKGYTRPWDAKTLTGIAWM